VSDEAQAGPKGPTRWGTWVRASAMVVGVLLVIVACEAHPAVPVSLNSKTLPVGLVNSPYTAKLTATGGRAPWMTSGHLPYLWTVKGLPSGLALHGDTISGTPLAAGTVRLLVQVRVAGNRDGRADWDGTLTCGGGETTGVPPSSWGSNASCQVLLHIQTLPQRQLFNALNTARTRLGLPKFGQLAAASTKAQQWAAHLAATGRLEQSRINDLQQSCSKVAAETVATGGDISAAVTSWVASAPDEAVIANLAYTRVGTGVVMRGDTRYLVAEFIGGC